MKDSSSEEQGSQDPVFLQFRGLAPAHTQLRAEMNPIGIEQALEFVYGYMFVSQTQVTSVLTVNCVSDDPKRFNI